MTTTTTTLEIVKPTQVDNSAVSKESTRIKVLTLFLMEQEQFEHEDVKECEHLGDNLFQVAGCEYYVLTDDEADDMAREYILDSLWSFNPSFIVAHLKNDLDIHEDEIKDIQNSLYERANPVLMTMIKDIDHFIEDAVRSDGRGHFISFYDGAEHEQGELFIYRRD